ncbi:preprotein translocase subunit SecD [Polaromonas sp. CG_9.5]|nr:preprotein translocase subunit SecD [Polaromonas sp. CG_9.5]
MHAALAQWQWIDKDGRKVFSDRAPPAEIPEKNILKQPGLRAPLPAADADAAPAAAAPLVANKAGTPKIPGKDTQLEARKKQAEDEENAKKKAEEEKLAKSRADNCERAKKGLVAVQSGTRLSVINAKGEREFMDDNERAKETKRLQGIADSDCQK